MNIAPEHAVRGLFVLVNESLLVSCQYRKIEQGFEQDEGHLDEGTLPTLVDKIVGSGQGKDKQCPRGYYPPFYG